MRKYLYLIFGMVTASLIIAACGNAAPEAIQEPVQEVNVPAAENSSESIAAEPVVEEQPVTEEIIEEEVAAEEMAGEEPATEMAETEAGETLQDPVAEATETTTDETVEEEMMAGEEMASEEAVAEEVAQINEEAAATESEAVAPVDWATHEGRTEDGFAFLGNPDAPVTMIDYSDFL